MSIENFPAIKTNHRRCDAALNVVWDLEREVLVRTDMAGVSTLCHGTVLVLRTVSVDSGRAIVLLIGLAVVAGQIGLDLSSDTHTVSDLDGLDSVANLDCAANDFVAYTERQRCLAPTSGDCVDIGGADTTCLNGNVNVAVLEGLELELERRSDKCHVKQISERGQWRTSPFENLLHSLWEWTMNPSAVSGYPMMAVN